MAKNTYSLSDVEFAKVEQMARLTLNQDEKKAIHSQLDEALKAVKVFDELTLSGVPPLEHPGNLNNVMREDVVSPSFTQAEALQNAPATHDGFVLVPYVLEDHT